MRVVVVGAVVFLWVCGEAMAQGTPPSPAPTITCELVDLNTSNVHIRVRWTDSVGETIYRIYRTQDETKLNDVSVWTLVASPSADTTSYDDYNVQPYDPVTNPKGTYYYKVRAVNAAGDVESNLCNETMPAVSTSGGSSGGGGGGGCFIDASGTDDGGLWIMLCLLSVFIILMRSTRRRTSSI